MDIFATAFVLLAKAVLLVNTVSVNPAIVNQPQFKADVKQLNSDYVLVMKNKSLGVDNCGVIPNQIFPFGDTSKGTGAYSVNPGYGFYDQK